MLNGNGSVDTSTHKLLTGRPPRPPKERVVTRLVGVIEHRSGGSRLREFAGRG